MTSPFSRLTVEAARRLLAARFRTANIETPELDARLLIGAALGLDHTGLAVQANRAVAAGEAETIETFARRRIAREPVARILGHKEFWGLDLALSDATLVPRPETETVVEASLEAIRGTHGDARALRIADLGTGSGAILLALLSELPDATGVGTDINPAALETARFNAAQLGLAGRAAFLRCNYADALASRFDLIVSNPPYIRSGDIAGLDADVRGYDPLLALDGGPDGLAAYRVIIPQAAALLVPEGVLAVEVGYDQSTAVTALARAAGLTIFQPARTDLSGVHRVVMGRKTAP